MQKKSFPLYAQILTAMLIGTVVGLVLGKDATALGEIGRVLITLIKTLAAPLLFFAVINAFIRTEVQWRAGLVMVAVCAINAFFAIFIGLTISNFLRPGEQMRTLVSTQTLPPTSTSAAKIDFLKTLTSYIPSSVVQPFIENSVITIILLAVLSGLALRRVKNEQIKLGQDDYKTIENGVGTVFRSIEIMLAWVIRFIPLAVFGVVAKTVGEQGFAPLRGLAYYVGAALLGLALQVVLVYQSWIIFVARMPLRTFWKSARDAVVYALGASSSLATLPVTLRCLNDLKVSPQASSLGACVGTNLNNDGILLYEAMAALFVAQVYGIHLTVGQQLLTAVSCVIAGIGIAGVPEAGLISLSLVLTTVGLPIEILPLLLTVDWVLSRARAITNVISDILVSVIIDRYLTRLRPESVER